MSPPSPRQRHGVVCSSTAMLYYSKRLYHHSLSNLNRLSLPELSLHCYITPPPPPARHRLHNVSCFSTIVLHNSYASCFAFSSISISPEPQLYHFRDDEPQQLTVLLHQGIHSPTLASSPSRAFKCHDLYYSLYSDKLPATVVNPTTPSVHLHSSPSQH